MCIFLRFVVVVLWPLANVGFLFRVLDVTGCLCILGRVMIECVKIIFEYFIHELRNLNAALVTVLRPYLIFSLWVVFFEKEVEEDVAGAGEFVFELRGQICCGHDADEALLLDVVVVFITLVVELRQAHQFVQIEGRKRLEPVGGLLENTL